MGHCSSSSRPTHEPVPTNPTDPAPPMEGSLSQHTLTPASSVRSSFDSAIGGGKTLEYERQAQQTSTDIMELFSIFGLLPPFKGNEKSIFSSKNERDMATMESLRTELVKIFANHAALNAVRPEEMMYSRAPTAALWLPREELHDENTRRESWRKTDSDLVPPSPLLRTASEGKTLLGASMLSPLEEGRGSLSLSGVGDHLRERDSNVFPTPLVIHTSPPPNPRTPLTPALIHSSSINNNLAKLPTTNNSALPLTPPSPTHTTATTNATFSTGDTTTTTKSTSTTATPTAATTAVTVLTSTKPTTFSFMTSATSAASNTVTFSSGTPHSRSPTNNITPRSLLFGTTPIKNNTNMNTNFTSSSSSTRNIMMNVLDKATPPKDLNSQQNEPASSPTERDSLVTLHTSATPLLRSAQSHESDTPSHSLNPPISNILPPLHGPIASPAGRRSSSIGYHAIDASLRLAATSPMGPNMRHLTTPNTPDDRETLKDLPRPWTELSADHLFFQLDLHKLHSWEFDPLSYDHPTARAFAAKIFVELGAVRRFLITPSKLFAFLEKVDNSYHHNRYHNFKHGLDVLHCNYMLLWATKLISMGTVGLRSVDILGFLVAGLCHDIGHPGTNNALEVNTRSNLALLYNDQSVLEHMHCAVTFKILAQPQFNIAESLSPTEVVEFRKVVIGCILATDMTHHFAMVARLGPLFSRLERQQQIPDVGRGNQDSDPQPTTVFRPVDVKELLNALIHFSDISNVAKPWEISRVWSERVTEEFFAQGDLERKLGLPISPFMDRSTGNQPQVTINFIDYVVGPLLLPIVRFFTNLATLAANIVENRERWEKMMMTDIEEKYAISAKGEKEKAERDTQLNSLAERTRKFKADFIDHVLQLSLTRKQSLARRASWNFNFKANNKSEASTVPSTPRAITATLSQGDVSIKS